FGFLPVFRQIKTADPVHPETTAQTNNPYGTPPSSSWAKEASFPRPQPGANTGPSASAARKPLGFAGWLVLVYTLFQRMKRLFWGPQCCGPQKALGFNHVQRDRKIVV